VVPYGDRQGGTATPVAGASEPQYNEFYPSFAPDDQLIAFNRAPSGQSSYNDSASEVFVVPPAGGGAVRLAANDPPMCAGRSSPGVTNSWPKWAPEVAKAGARSYYWLTFSSTRAGGGPQLYVTGVILEAGTIRTTPAIYIWNQPADQSNHTPAWDVFDIVQ
jgi:hypothetical protein